MSGWMVVSLEPKRKSLDRKTNKSREPSQPSNGPRRSFTGPEMRQTKIQSVSFNFCREMWKFSQYGVCKVSCRINKGAFTPTVQWIWCDSGLTFQHCWLFYFYLVQLAFTLHFVRAPNILNKCHMIETVGQNISVKQYGGGDGPDEREIMCGFQLHPII